MKKLKPKRNDINPEIQSMFLSLFVVIGVFIACSDDDQTMEPWEPEVARLKRAIEPYKNFGAAEDAGYDIKATEYRTQMGFHYLNAGLLDAKFEVEKPEVLIFVNDPMGNLELVAVEYGIPIADIDNPPPAPEGFIGGEDVWKVDTEFNLWTLHAWVVMENPEGIFTAMNPVLP